MTSTFSARKEKALRSLGIPVVWVDPIRVPRTTIVRVGPTNRSGGLEATRHLIDFGHIHIAYIGGPTDAACHVAPHARVLRRNSAGGTRARPQRVPVRTVHFARGMEAAHTMGINVPHELSHCVRQNVARFNLFLAAHDVHQPVEEMGRTAVDTVQKLARGESLPSRRVELSAHLVVRDSTAPPRRKS